VSPAGVYTWFIVGCTTMNSNEGKPTTGLCAPGIRLPFSFFFFFSFLFFSLSLYDVRVSLISFRNLALAPFSSASGFLWIDHRTIANNRRNIDITSQLRSAFLDTRCRGCLLHLRKNLANAEAPEVNQSTVWLSLLIKSLGLVSG